MIDLCCFHDYDFLKMGIEHQAKSIFCKVHLLCLRRSHRCLHLQKEFQRAEERLDGKNWCITLKLKIPAME